jgi:hypothetical protein
MSRFRPAPSLAVLAGLILALAGCSDDDASPIGPQAEAPVLPEAADLTFDFSFFDDAEPLDPAKAAGEYDHFVNAYLRVVVLDLVAHLVLAPPVTAFAAAVHTPPSLQDDGSWIWVYTHVDGQEELQIRLRGLPVGEGVEWELRVSAGPYDQALWFAGTTRDRGETGAWTFYSLDDPELAEGAISWGDDAGSRFLRFEALAGEDAGDVLEFRDMAPAYNVTHLDADLDAMLTIDWWEDGHGSMTAPDYAGGVPVCWDTGYRNTTCE